MNLVNGGREAWRAFSKQASCQATCAPHEHAGCRLYSPHATSHGHILLILVFASPLFYALVVVLAPWAVHIGGRWTPLLSREGWGNLATKGGQHSLLFVSFFASSHFSRLHMDGLHPRGGVQGYGWLCTSPRAMQRLRLSGTIFGAWRSTEGSLLAFRLLEPKIIDVGHRQGFFDLIGRWKGPELVMDGRNTVGGLFRSG